MTILLTGTTGFVGRHVLPLLLAEGHLVIALARREIKAEPVPGWESVITVIGDVATGQGFDEIPWAELDAVIHLAASGVKASHRVWADAVAVNVVGTQRLLAAIKTKAMRTPTVFVARTFYEPLTAQAPALLENPYIATKQAASELAALWAETYAGSTVLGTFFQVYGPDDASGNVLNYAARELKAGRPAIFGSGRGLRDWIYITDAAAAVVASVKTASNHLSEVDIGTGALVTIRTAIEALASESGQAEAVLTFDPAKDRADVDLHLAATARPANWSPALTLRQGLKFLYEKS